MWRQESTVNLKNPTLIVSAGAVIAFAAIAVTAYYLLTLRMRKIFLKEEKEISEEPTQDSSHV